MRYSFIIILIFSFIFLLSIILLYKSLSDVDIRKFPVIVMDIPNNKNDKVKVKNENKDTKYILQWTLDSSHASMEKGQDAFMKRNCPHTNCYITTNRTLLGDYRNFDVIAFDAIDVTKMTAKDLPERRSSHQRYLFTATQSSDRFPVCSKIFNGFFNLTWTYKLDSDLRRGYVVIRDAKKNIIGPHPTMHWMKVEDMDPISEQLKKKLKKKTKAAAWFVSTCFTRSNREGFVQNLIKEMKKYNHTIDIYGKCGFLKCPENDCFKILGDKYYFYLSFENSFSDDYVTESILYPLQNDVVPIVFGAANYTRFIPDDIYINAKKTGVKRLAAKIHELINNPKKYSRYFKWKNHYSFHKKSESVKTDDYCELCSLLNDAKRMKDKSAYENFVQWWTPSHRC